MIFGAVINEASRAVVDAISAVETDPRGRPVQDVIVTSVDITGQFPRGHGVAAQQQGATHHTVTETPESSVIRPCDTTGACVPAASPYPVHPS